MPINITEKKITLSETSHLHGLHNAYDSLIFYSQYVSDKCQRHSICKQNTPLMPPSFAHYSVMDNVKKKKKKKRDTFSLAFVCVLLSL